MKPISSFNLDRPKEKELFVDGTPLPSNFTTQRKKKACEWVLVEIVHLFPPPRIKKLTKKGFFKYKKPMPPFYPSRIKK
jgi:hypothetical protein